MVPLIRKAPTEWGDVESAGWIKVDDLVQTGEAENLQCFRGNVLNLKLDPVPTTLHLTPDQKADEVAGNPVNRLKIQADGGRSVLDNSVDLMFGFLKVLDSPKGSE